MSFKRPDKHGKRSAKWQKQTVDQTRGTNLTISSLFKKQFQKNCRVIIKEEQTKCIQEHDNEVEFVKEEMSSPYFNKKKKQLSAAFNSSSVPCSSAGDNCDVLDNVAKRRPTPYKLSLKKREARSPAMRGNNSEIFLSPIKSGKTCTASMAYTLTDPGAKETAGDCAGVNIATCASGTAYTSWTYLTAENQNCTSSSLLMPSSSSYNHDEIGNKSLANSFQQNMMKSLTNVFQNNNEHSKACVSMDFLHNVDTFEMLSNEKNNGSKPARRLSLKRHSQCKITSPNGKRICKLSKVVQKSDRHHELERIVDSEKGNSVDVRTADEAGDDFSPKERNNLGIQNCDRVATAEKQKRQSSEKVKKNLRKISLKSDRNDDEDDQPLHMDADEESRSFHLPYYLENFKIILQSVLTDDENIRLFNEEDLHVVSSFNNLSEEAQKLYVRLFSRKLTWLPASRIRYPEIAADLTTCFVELVAAELLDSGQALTNLESVLKVMSAAELRILSKTYHLNPNSRQKGQIMQDLLQMSQANTVATMFGCKGQSAVLTMIARAKKLLGSVYHLQENPRAVFIRALMLFSLVSTSGDDESGNGGQNQLFHMLLVNMGKLVYPPYTINRQTSIFKEREDLIRFEKALQLEHDLLRRTTNSDWAGAYTIYLQVKEHYLALTANVSTVNSDSSLPEFLRSFTAGSVLVRLLNQGIEILQRRKDYTAAVTLIQELLSQHIYNSHMRGYWWDRLSLNLDVHLKQQEEALKAVQDGMDDPLVRSGHRLALFLRAESICNKPNSPFKKRLEEFYHEPLAELPKSVVEGKVLPHTVPGLKYQFVTNTSYGSGHSEDVTLCNVEQLVLDHYRVNGFPEGLHAEGAVVSSLFCFYFWDILFMDLPDAFHSPYQITPLDLHTDAFYQRRQPFIDERLSQIQNSTNQELHDMLIKTWEEQQGVTCAEMKWERFTSVQQIQGLVTCMGGNILAGILGRYAQQPRHIRGGFPDLTLWNTETKQLKISEVKGPGDRLSHKQMLWLDYLLKLGVDAEVCHVKAVCAKRLKPK